MWKTIKSSMEFEYIEMLWVEGDPFGGGEAAFSAKAEQQRKTARN